MLRIGLTGGIGSGKSTVAQLLCAGGATLLDADEIARAVTAAGGPAIGPITTAFGADFITSAGALDRDRMRQATFSDATLRARLEAIVHPLVGLEFARLQEQAVAAAAKCLVFDIPLLAESAHWRQRLDQVIVVDCLPEVQIARVMARSGLERSVIERIIASQASRQKRLNCADIVVFNAGATLAPLQHVVQQIVQRFGL